VGGAKAPYLHVALLQQRLVAVGGGPRDVGALALAVGSQALVQQEAGGAQTVSLWTPSQ